MSQLGVQKLVGRLVSDENFRTSFFKDANKAVADSGYAVDEHELAGLRKLQAKDLQVKVAKNNLGKVASWEVSSLHS